MYLVTGGCGFIGSHLVDLLIDKGYNVRVLDDLSNSSKDHLSPKADFIFGSICDEEACKKALQGVKGVFHLAALVSVPESIAHWYKSHLVNCSGTIRLFELCRGIPIIFASSAAVYGDSAAQSHKEGSPPRPLSPYAVDKLSCEMHAQLAWHLYRTPTISFRFFNVYGSRQNPHSPYSGVISKFASRIKKKEPLIIYGDGNQQRDFIYVKDVVNMLFKSMETPFTGSSVYNLCTGRACTINRLADLISQVTGNEAKKEYRPARSGEIVFSRGDPHKVYQELGLKASITLEEGLKLLMQEIK